MSAPKHHSSRQHFVTVIMDEDMKGRVTTRAKELRRSRSGFVTMLLGYFVDLDEDQLHEIAMAAAIRRASAGCAGAR